MHNVSNLESIQLLQILIQKRILFEANLNLLRMPFIFQRRLFRYVNRSFLNVNRTNYILLSNMSTTTYTLEVPATYENIFALFCEIMDDTENLPDGLDTRVILKFGTCSLLCEDEAERREFNNKVKARSALEVLRNSAGHQ